MTRAGAPLSTGSRASRTTRGWPLAPLLELRALAEARQLEELARALAGASRAEDEAAHRAAAVELARGGLLSRVTAPGGDLARGHRFLERLRADAAEALRRAAATAAAAAQARERHARARVAREALERERERWSRARERAREAFAERDLDDLLARSAR